MHLLTLEYINSFIFLFFCIFIDHIFASESLDTPIAFPIFRPPMVAVQRHKTSAENLQINSLNNTNTHSEVEEISNNFNNDNTSEPSLEGLLGGEEEEVPIITTEEFKEEKMNKNNSKQIELEIINNTKLIENFEVLRNLKNETKIRHFNNSNYITHVINTPQFPLFTGMGMEIIDNPSNDAENENKLRKDEMAENHKKMHYHQINFKNNSKLNKKYFNLKHDKKEEFITTISPLNINLLSSTTLKTTKQIEKENKLEEKENKPFIVQQSLSEHLNNNLQVFNVSEDVGSFSSLFNTTELINNENITTDKQELFKEKNIKNVNVLNTTINNIIIPTTTTPLLFTEEIENIFAFSENISSSPLFTPTTTTTTTTINFEDFGKLNNGRDELDNGFERVTMHLDEDINLPVNNGSINEEPSQQGLLTTQNIIPFNSNSFALPSTKIPTETTEQIQNVEFTSTIIPTINTLNAPSTNKNEVIDHLHQQHQKGLEFPPMGNHLEEGNELSNHIEDKKDKTENKELTDGNGIENEHKENDIDGGSLNENSNIGESMKRTSKYSTTTSSSDNLRIFVLLGIITILLVTIALGSIFSARYVKRSRQLHGKYQPAAYEMQTQQRENRYQTSINYSSTQTSLYRQPSSPLPSANNNNFVQQPQINATFGKEERLI